ncbi:MAG: hypothetical protein Q9165_005122 [Trypethelium subeluteriae]
MRYSSLKKVYDQSFRIPPPDLTEQNLADQNGKVFIVTGYVGCGFELAKILYRRNGTIYLAGRNEEKGLTSIKAIKDDVPQSQGHIEFLKVDLADLSSIKPAVDSFLAKSNKLHCLTNNAGVMNTPNGSKTIQGYELQMGTNCLGPYLFTKLLLPVLGRTAATSPPGSVRVTWAGSLATEVMAPEGGIEFDAQGAPKVLGKSVDYGQSKVGNVFIAHELAKRAEKDGIVSVRSSASTQNRPLLFRILPSYIRNRIPRITSFHRASNGIHESRRSYSTDSLDIGTPPPSYSPSILSESIETDSRNSLELDMQTDDITMISEDFLNAGPRLKSGILWKYGKQGK